MCELREFDVHARGAACLAEEWKKNHAEVRKVWKVEDLITLCNKCSRDALVVYKHFLETSDKPSTYRFSHFVSILEEIFLPALKKVCGDGGVIENEGYAVNGLNDLRQSMATLDAIVQDDRFATNAAFTGGALDAWD